MKISANLFIVLAVGFGVASALWYMHQRDKAKSVPGATSTDNA